jgi:tRNA(Ile)-lysidine synthase
VLDRVLSNIEQQHLITEGESLLVGVSGGPDSVALLDILVSFSKKRDNRLIVCHFNHLLRGEDSALDSQFVARLAEKHGLTVEIREGDVRKYARDQKLSLEDAARVLRYEFFRDVAHEYGVHKLALAHNADDQIETLILRFFRGAGLRGLAAMQSERKMKDLIIVRPLLDVWKREIVAYLNDRKLSCQTDLSNFDPVFTRNRIRLELIPQLEAEYNPGIKKLLHKTADIVADDDRLLDEMARAAYEQCCTSEALHISTLVVHDIALQRRIIRHWLAQCTVPVVPSFEQVEAICALTGRKGGGFGSVDLPNKKIVYRDYDFLIIGDPLVHEMLEVHRPVKIPGETPVPELGVNIKTDVIETNAAFALPHQNEKGVEYFDLDQLGEALALRNWHQGDRYQPIGLKGTKKLHDIFVDAKISSRERHKIPLLVNDVGEICWVIGYRIAESFKIKSTTRKVLRVRVDRMPPDSQPHT